jgi:hypothetical protein
MGVCMHVVVAAAVALDKGGLAHGLSRRPPVETTPPLGAAVCMCAWGQGVQ